MEVEVQGVAEVSAGAVEGAHVADHGEDDGEGGVWGVEGDIEELGGVDEVVDGFEGVDGALVVAADGVVFGFGVFERVAAHDGGVVCLFACLWLR